jgi:two-component system LytT family response regulator
MLKAYLLDDEVLAIERLERLLREDTRIAIAGKQTDPISAIREIDALQPDLLFLDIQMPECDGFQVLRSLRAAPLVIFATAFDQYALDAFETNSVAYLLKPVLAEKLRLAIDKVERILQGKESKPELEALVAHLAKRLAGEAPALYPQRISSRIGDRVEFIELARVTHFYAEDKLVYASTPEKSYVVDQTITELADKLDPTQFVRIHRSALVNVSYVSEMYSLLAGKYLLRLRDGKRTELVVAKERVKGLRERLGL